MRSAFLMFKVAVTKILARPTLFLSIIAVPAIIAVVASLIEPATDSNGDFIWESSTQMYQYTANIIVLTVVSTVMTVATIFAINNTELTVSDVYKLALQKMGAYLLMVIIGLIVISIGIVLLILPGVWLSVCLMFASYYIVLRNSKAVDSLKLSFALVKGRWWKVFGKTLMFALLYVLVVIPFYILFWFVGISAGEEVSYALESVLGIVGSLVTVAFMYEFFLDLERTQVAQAETDSTTTPTASV